MVLTLLMILIAVLYWRVWGFHYIIDDIVRRWDYLYVVPRSSPPPEFYSARPNPWRNFLPVITHALNVWLLYILFGPIPSLLFLINPLSVNGAAWKTGGYYSFTTFLALTSFFFIHQFPITFSFLPFANIAGALVSTVFFTAALGSTIICVGLPFLFLLPISSYWGLILFWPLVFYLFGHRFRTGYKIRNMGKKDTTTWRKIFLMTKVVAYYIRLCLFPNKLAFFRQYGFGYMKEKGVRARLESADGEFWFSLLTILVFSVVGWHLSPLGVVWFFVTIGPFSQFKILGQFIAERYTYLPNVGIALILAPLCQNPIILMIVCLLYAYKTMNYIPAFSTISQLYIHGIKDHPDCISNYANLGERYLHIGKHLEAKKLFEKGLFLEKYSFLCLVNIAAYFSVMTSWEKSLYYTEMAIKHGPREFAIVALAKQRVDLLKIIFHEQGIDKHMPIDVCMDEMEPGDSFGIIEAVKAIKLGYIKVRKCSNGSLKM